MFQALRAKYIVGMEFYSSLSRFVNIYCPGHTKYIRQELGWLECSEEAGKDISLSCPHSITNVASQPKLSTFL